MFSPRLILWLLVILAVISIGVYYVDPELSSRSAQAQRDAAFTGETRQTMLLLVALGLGAFIAYLAITRRP